MMTMVMPSHVADATHAGWQQLTRADSLAIARALHAVAVAPNAPPICAALLRRVKDAFHRPSSSPVLVRDSRVELGRAGYWDGTRIRLDGGFLARASGSGLVAALMHEMAHDIGFEHSPVTTRRGWYAEFPFRYLDFTEDENFDSGEGRCLVMGALPR